MGVMKLKLAELRKQRRLTQRQLAALAGVRPDTISALESGKSMGMQFDTLTHLCEALHCQPGEIFDLELDEHEVHVLGGPDEDQLLLARLEEYAHAGRTVDGPSFVAELQRLAGEVSAHTEPSR